MPDARIISEGLKRGKVERQKGEFEYVRFRESFRGIERGTAIIDGRVVWGYPHIKRIFTLERGVGRNITAGTVYAEEKIDGFNVRMALVDGRVCAFSRGGFLDMFATEKAREMGFERFFRANPDCVLCGEMIGNTPHTKPSDEYDVKLYVFDIDRGDGDYLPPPERYAALKRFGIEGVPVLGQFDSSDFQGLKKLALAINKGRKEGMVLKSADRKEIVKYVTPWSDIEDIERTSGILFDMPIGFYYQRVLRSAFFISDFGLDRDEYAKKLGRAFYGNLIGAIKNAGEGRGVEDEFEISFKDPKVWDDIRRRMGREVKVEEIWRKRDGAQTRLRFRKIYKKSSRMLLAFADGKGMTD
ncbi:RNA ligase [Candidatus Micrarchaeota archaeon]|nr:RNA ligase [Candidatus Micrarchaeota archaeon]